MNNVTIIGGGLAGTEAAYQVAKRGINVILYEMKPIRYSPAHKDKNLAEIVCSNSLKSNLLTNACGLLKQELREEESLLMEVAEKVKVPAGQALAVDREEFAKLVTQALEECNQKKEFGKIEIIRKEIQEIPKEGIVIIATGPLTSDSLAKSILKLTNKQGLYFYDAASPILLKESIDFTKAFWGDRYGKGENGYINLPMTKEEYDIFYEALIKAEVVTLHEFEKREIFEGCIPIEIMAKRGKNTLCFGPLKPVGFMDPRTQTRPHAIVQLRQDNKQATLFNMVGFQTNLKYGEQKRVFSLIPGLENAEFIKYGVMHRNTYLNSPELLDHTYQLRTNRHIYFAGQITGVEGYVESISSGLVAGINAANQVLNKEKRIYPKETMIGALANYISSPNIHFQPMNANFGILPELPHRIKDKKLKYEQLVKRALTSIKKE